MIDGAETAVVEPSRCAGDKRANPLAAISEAAKGGETDEISTDLAANAQPGETAGVLPLQRGWCHLSRGHMTISNFSNVHWSHHLASEYTSDMIARMLMRASHATRRRWETLRLASHQRARLPK